ncbi:RDD family protein [Actinoplanes sp. NBRC 14428]|uniref:Putative RDD family membrane protein YckC n=1 Tax=Pseudosporangium ferrugineum TaxID=439699 RepID=A0A2T0S9Z4_9ACTN|nr:RDD family protein [Pseudosporangium ferrugineum]PRY30222.1 putative RDD family membrane protein YckC [Pseudosporangium ferrugineum]BCJ51210.1 RDD family protein [Actinoplanes sp. NBRC 14428]
MATPAYDPTRLQPADFGRRFAALLIDWALCLLAASFYADPRVVAWPPVVVLIFLNMVFIGLFGQTPGMALARLRCVSAVDGGAIGMPKGLLRGVLLALLIPAVIMDADRRGLHDRAAGSIVVKQQKATS